MVADEEPPMYATCTMPRRFVEFLPYCRDFFSFMMRLESRAQPEAPGLDLGYKDSLQEGAPFEVVYLQDPAGLLDR